MITNNLLIFITLFFFLITIAILAVFLILIHKKIKKLLLGKKGNDLEETIMKLIDETKKLNNDSREKDEKIKEIKEKLQKSIQNVKLIRFNAFSDSGGNQSFAVGMTNEEGSGVVISSLYSREKTNIFAKPIKKNKSEFELSKEEQEVISK